MNAENFSDSLQRTFEVADCRTQIELAAFFGVRQSSISDARRKKAIPCEWLLHLLKNHRVNPEWVLTGIVPRFLHPTWQQPDIYSQNPLKEVPTKLLIEELAGRVDYKGQIYTD